MNEQHKIDEAEFFLGQMDSTSNQPAVFQHLLSALLSSARSVLQYALEEAKQRPGGRQWYDSQVAANAVLKFFKDKRDINIHVMPVNVVREIAATDMACISISESVSIVITRYNGTLEKREIVTEPAAPLATETTSSVRERFRFSDWPGPEDVVTLSRIYLNELKSFTESGMHAGYVSG